MSALVSNAASFGAVAGMIKLYDKDTGAPLGELSEEQLTFLQEQLEEEGAGDQDYYLNPDTIDLLAEAGAPAGLVVC